jgi:hypothetical protein
LGLVFKNTATSKNDELRYGAPGESAVHIRDDMQRMWRGHEVKDAVRPAGYPFDHAHPSGKTIVTRLWRWFPKAEKEAKS